DLLNECILYRKTIAEKSDDEIVSLVIKKRTEAAIEFQRSVEQSLKELSDVSSRFENKKDTPPRPKRAM
ncbi:DUF4756 family protein, partial [Salmonella enterica]|nr:DUF4756 family protein [Salmonella enterica]